jgi:uncharacterized protein (DUF924 family)
MITPQQVYDFWFGTDFREDAAYLGSRMPMWFGKDPKIDTAIRSGFAGVMGDTAILESWRQTSQGLLAAVILHDQFPRNAFRGSARMFEYDSIALNLAHQAVSGDLHRTLPVFQAMFLLLPFEHSEKLQDQDTGVRLFSELAGRAPLTLEKFAHETYDYAVRHRDIILRFGRFPHRNAILGRTSTAEELAFLETPGSSF